MNKRKLLKQRRTNGFILAVVLVFCMAALLLLVSLFPLIDQVVRLESSSKYSAELRTAADFGIDYSLQQLNVFADTYPGQLAPMVNTGPHVIPSAALTAFPGIQVTVTLQKISPADWTAFSSGSTIYSTDLDLPTGPYLVIESRAKRGMLTKTIRSFLEPTYNLPVSDASRNYGLTNKESYFDIPLYSASNIERDDNLPDLIVQKGSGSSSPFPYTGAPDLNISLTAGQANPSPPARSPIPTPGITKNLNSAMDLQGNYSLLPGSYSSPAVEFLSPNSVNFDVSGGEGAVKIFVQDGSASSSNLTAINIKASSIRNSPSPENFQLWYNGTRPINIELDADFNGIIYATKAPITTSGYAKFNGAIVANKLTLNNTGEMIIVTNLIDNGANSSATKGGLTRSVNAAGEPVAHGYKAVSWQDLSAAP